MNKGKGYHTTGPAQRQLGEHRVGGWDEKDRLLGQRKTVVQNQIRGDLSLVYMLHFAPKGTSPRSCEEDQVRRLT